MKICILTAGKGSRMGPLDKDINKALLPVKDKAIISHIIEFFSPDDEFVIGLGYLGEQVKDYLTIAHPEKIIHYVNIENFEGVGSGPGYSLLCCKEFLQEPFYFVPCDGIFEGDLKSAPNGNWVGTKQVRNEESENYCNLSIKDGIVVEIKDKEKCSEDYVAFTGILYVKNFEEFWNSLEDTSIVKGEHQISNGFRGLMEGPGLFGVEMNWTDLGELEKYRNFKRDENAYNFEKINEFTYFVNGKTIKFFSDEKNIRDRNSKSILNQKVFPKIIDKKEQFFSYEFFPGETFYSCGNFELFKNLLSWLKENLWEKKNVDSKIMVDLCTKFYYEKTLSRIEFFESLNPNYQYPTKINKVKVIPLPEIIKKIPWELLFEGIPTFIHGDLQFDNIIYNKKLDKFLLIDWRQDFAGKLEFGDLYYDIAKLYGGILLNYDFIKKGLFKFSQSDKEVTYDFAIRNSNSKYKEILEEFIKENKLDEKKIQALAISSGLPILFIGIVLATLLISFLLP